VKGPKNRNNPSIRGPQQESEWVFSWTRKTIFTLMIVMEAEESA
jgi:hypothetical protein